MTIIRLCLRLALTLSLLAGLASAQLSLTTLYAQNNVGDPGGAFYFDLTVDRTVRIDALDTNFDATVGSSVGLQVYTTPTSYVGNETNMGAWTMVAQDDGNAVASAVNEPTEIALQSSFTLTPGSYGVALVAINAAHRYTNGTGLNLDYAGFGVQMTNGAATNVPFSGGVNSPRVWNGTIYYRMDSGCLVHTVTGADGNLRGVDLADGTTLVTHGITVPGDTVTGADGLVRVGSDVFTTLRILGETNSFLARLNLDNGQATVIGNLGDVYASLAALPDGTLLGVTADGATFPSTLYAIDTTTANTVSLLALGIGSNGEAITWHADYKGLLHASGRDGLLNDPLNGPNVEVVSVDRGRTKSLRLSGFASDQITAMIAAPNRGIVLTTIDQELVTVDKKGVLTQNLSIDHVPSGMLPRDPMGGAVRGKVAFKMRFDVMDGDALSVTLQGVVLDPAFDANGASINIDIGNVPSGFVTLDERGQFKVANGGVSFKQNRRDGTWSIQLKVKNVGLGALGAFGFTNADQVTNLPLCVRVTTALDRVETVFVLQYKAKLDKGGKAR